jgi:hypothetical protein
MTDRSACIEALARMAARYAGHDPDRHETVKFGEIVAFEGPLWRYPDFLIRAETAYKVLKGSRLVRLKDLERLDASEPEELDGRSIRMSEMSQPPAQFPPED